MLSNLVAWQWHTCSSIFPLHPGALSRQKPLCFPKCSIYVHSPAEEFQKICKKRAMAIAPRRQAATFPSCTVPPHRSIDIQYTSMCIYIYDIYIYDIYIYDIFIYIYDIFMYIYIYDIHIYDIYIYDIFIYIYMTYLCIYIYMTYTYMIYIYMTYLYIYIYIWFIYIYIYMINLTYYLYSYNVQ